MADVAENQNNNVTEELEEIELDEFETGRSKQNINKIEKLKRELAEEEAKIKEKREKLKTMEEAMADRKRQTRKKIEIGALVLKRAGWAGIEKWPELKKIKKMDEILDDYETRLIEKWKAENPMDFNEHDKVCLSAGKRIWDMTDRLSLDFPTVIDSIIKTAEENARRWEDTKQ